MLLIPNETILFNDQEPVLYKGEDHLVEEMDGLKFRNRTKEIVLSTKSRQALQLYRTAREFARFTGNEIVYDLYSRIRTISNYIAPYVNKVIGIEYVDEAVEDA